MPCHHAVIADKTTVPPDMSVGKVLALLKKKKLSYMPIVDEDGVLQGYFSADGFMKSILRVAVDMQTGVVLDTLVGTAPGVAKRLQGALEMPVYQYCERKVRCVGGETPLWEGLKLLTEFGAPVFVIDPQKQKYCGLITNQSALDALRDFKE